MKLGEKLILLREKKGLSQDELADMLSVSKKTLAKWEKGQLMPDIEKIVKLTEIFGINSDILIKDDVEITEDCKIYTKIEPPRNVDYSEAEGYLKNKFLAARYIAFATVLIMLSPGIMLTFSSLPLSSGVAAAAIGLSAMFILCACGVGIYIYANSMTVKYEYIEKGSFTVDYSVSAMLASFEEKMLKAYTVRNVFATVISIISLLPLIITSLFSRVENIYLMLSLTGTLLIAGIGVAMFITSGIKRSAVYTLSKSKKAEAAYSKRLEDSLSGSFWTLVIAIYLLYSFKSGNWRYSWLIIVFAGALSALVSSAFSLIRRAGGNKNDREE
jgi:transcriptional regulator with XRE-family HTH domain